MVMKEVVKDIRKIFKELETGDSGGLLGGIFKSIGLPKDFNPISALFDKAGSLVGIGAQASSVSLRSAGPRVGKSGAERPMQAQAMQGGGQTLVY